MEQDIFNEINENAEHVILSENLEDLRKAVEWGREQQKILKGKECGINTAACAKEYETRKNGRTS